MIVYGALKEAPSWRKKSICMIMQNVHFNRSTELISRASIEAMVSNGNWKTFLMRNAFHNNC